MEQFSRLIDEIPITNKIAPPAGGNKDKFSACKTGHPATRAVFYMYIVIIWLVRYTTTILLHLVESASVADEHNGN